MKLLNVFQQLFHLRQKEVALPNYVAGFSLLRPLTKNSDRPCLYDLGIYRNKKGQKALFKRWRGPIKNFAYYTLKNEIRLNEIFTNVQKRLHHTKTAHAKMPELLYTSESNNMLIQMTEFIEGKPVKEKTLTTKVAAYRKAINYIRSLDAQLTIAEKKLISHRTSLQLILLYPFLLVKALISYPAHTGWLLMGTLLFVKAIPSLLQQRAYVMTHRDLHGNNLLATPNSIAVIDLQFGVRTLPMYEYVLILMTEWQDQAFCREIYQELLKITSDQILIKGLAVNAVTHLMTDNHFPTDRRKIYAKFLQFAVSSGVQTTFHYASI